jgi:hypothetical protein
MKRGHILLLAALGGLVLATAGVDLTPAGSSKANSAALVSDCGQPAGCTAGDPGHWASFFTADIGTIFARAPR